MFGKQQNSTYIHAQLRRCLVFLVFVCLVVNASFADNVYQQDVDSIKNTCTPENIKTMSVQDLLSKCLQPMTNILTAQRAYDEAKANQQSLANRTLTAASVATMGIGAMQLAQGLSEKQADAAADKDMAAYMASMRCSYGDGQSVHMGPDSIELPTSDEIRAYRAEYLALAESLKFRKEALGLKPGIESEVIINKENTGLYDDQNTGITSGAYASRYREAGGNEEDQKGLNADKKEAKTRMIAGGAVAGAGLVGSVIGNAVINGGSNKTLSSYNSSYSLSNVNNVVSRSKDVINKIGDVKQDVEKAKKKIEEATPAEEHASAEGTPKEEAPAEEAAPAVPVAEESQPAEEAPPAEEGQEKSETEQESSGE